MDTSSAQHTGSVASHSTPVIDYRADAARWAQMGRYDRAADLYTIALEFQPGDVGIRMRLAECLVRAKRSLAAARRYVELASLHIERRSPRQALEVSKKLLQLCPEYFSAADVADVMLAIGPQAMPLCRLAARLHHRDCRDDQAADLLLLCTRLSPRDAGPWRELAMVYLGHQMRSEAAWALRQAYPILRTLDDPASCIECLRSILWLDPSDLEALRELPQMLIRAGRPELALRELGSLLKLNPSDEVGIETMAQAFALVGRLAACLSLLEQRAAALRAHDRGSEIQALLERARRWRPEDTEFEHALGGLGRSPRPRTSHRNCADEPIGNDDATHVLQLVPDELGARVTSSRNNEVLDVTEMVEFLEDQQAPAASRRGALLPPPPPVRTARALAV